MAILAVGFFVVLLSGGIDISFPAVAIVAQYITVNAIIALGIDNLWLAFAISSGHRHCLRRGERLLHLVLPDPDLHRDPRHDEHLPRRPAGVRRHQGHQRGAASRTPSRHSAWPTSCPCTRADGTTYGLSVFFLVVVGVILVTWVILRYTVLGPGHLRHGREHGGGEEVRVQHRAHPVLHLLLRGPAGLHHGHHPRVPDPLQQRHLHHRLASSCTSLPRWSSAGRASWEARGRSPARSSGWS